MYIGCQLREEVRHSWEARAGESGFEYQDMWYWNPVSRSVGRFGGYGYFSVKNWRYEFDINENSWSQIEANSPGRGPWGRTAARNYALAADGQSVFLFGGDGNSTGNQGYVDPGYFGNGSTTGEMDRLCGLWRLDFSTGMWTNYLAGNNYTYPYTGPIVHFPPLNAVLMVMGWGYTPTNFGVGISGVALYRLGQDPGFIPVVLSGDIPDIADWTDSSVFYDNASERVIYFDQKGVYALKMEPGTGDSDGDGIADDQDQCPNTPQGAIVDAQGCSIDQLVPCAGPASGGTWKNHGQYVSAVAKEAEDFLAGGLITEAQAETIISQAAKSDCRK